ncbi:MAG: hypothetical protein COU81_00430 [Candidatus Portnoybacteria bacterium CG10_big_fil_rev_8_21_14_0_10_36_7]|uniref:Uncharacterized protein n=1 Tax=Candidatus Portnoybacteria bacterium CG10_big_fil_rev_8_21_14_0_10_36_7 TaxID=1974812 RepID=A0A2M8KF00_9BACT|nr:MAG: hypothetical protein COU81_00430 [Candidatus Portnoybacteria bacterium CG10_big_fil_rev_8_21_14_0_10_36_7]
MKQITFISGLILGKLLGWSSFFMIMFAYSPESGFDIIFITYISLFVSLVCTITLATLFILKKVREANFDYIAGQSLAEGIFATLIIWGILTIIKMNILFSWAGAVLIALAIAGQLFIIQKKELFKL